MRRDVAGQAVVEFVALLPLLVAVGLATFSVIASGRAAEQAGAAAGAGAMALLQDRNPREAAREALPDAVRRASRVQVRGRRVTVRVVPRLPIGAERLARSASADAGAVP